MSITCSVCVCVCVCARTRVTLVVKHEKRMRHIILPSGACPAVPYFPTLSHKRHDFREKLLDINTCLDFAYSIFETFLILKKIQQVIVINDHGSACEVPVIPVRFLLKI
jgi:hypothetical protein